MAGKSALGLALTLVVSACVSANPGVVSGPVRCSTDSVESAVFDYGLDAVGHETIGEAIAAFREDPNWQLRDDWRALNQGDPSATPVAFRDRRGWVYLSVDLIRLNDSWLVGGYTSCSPGSS